MQWYYTVFLLTLLPVFFRWFRQRGVIDIIVALVCIFVCLGYMTGSDWRNYEVLYYSDFENYSKEIGWYYYCLIFKTLGVDFWCFFISTKVLLFYLSVNFIKKRTINGFYISLVLFYGIFMPPYYIDNPMRNLIASIIFLYSLKYVIDRKLVKFILMIVLAASFHTSVLLLVPIYFLHKSKPKPTFLIKLVLIILIANFFCDTYAKTQIALLIELFGEIGERGQYYLLNENVDMFQGRYFSFGLLVRLVLFFFVFSKRDYIYKQLPKSGVLILNLFLLEVSTYLLSYSIPIIGRYTLYFDIIFIYCLALALIDLRPKIFKFTQLFYIVFSFLLLTKTITSSSKYIPYTNYLYYTINGINLNYQDRVNYNKVNSPYKIEERNK